MLSDLTVYLVEDDPSVRDSFALMLGLWGHRTAVFADAESLLAAWRADWLGCVIADLRLPGASGLDLQAELRRRGSRIPVIIITAHGDVPTARQAFQAEAVDFLEKPVDEGQLRSAIERAFAQEEGWRSELESRRRQAERLASLTPREREVLEQVVTGQHAREVGEKLGISPRTVEVHKTRIMLKLGARNAVELVRLAVLAGLDGEK